MKKKIFILMVGLLLIGLNVYAEGDLAVNGNVSVGTVIPTVHKLNIAASDVRAANYLTTSVGASVGIAATTEMKLDNSSSSNKNTLALQNFLRITGHSTTAELTAQVNNILVEAGPTSPITHANVRGTTTGLTAGNISGGNTVNVTKVREFASLGLDGASSIGGTINVTDYIRFDIQDDLDAGTSISNLYGLKIEKLTAGQTANYGIVLDGDGSGSDIVFGSNQEARIYSEKSGSDTFLYSDDSGGNHTRISPHDPVTGEWVYYSKNLKTGRVVQVNMEKLVKAVEKLTGEKFMIESLEETK